MPEYMELADALKQALDLQGVLERLREKHLRQAAHAATKQGEYCPTCQYSGDPIVYLKTVVKTLRNGVERENRAREERERTPMPEPILEGEESVCITVRFAFGLANPVSARSHMRRIIAAIERGEVFIRVTGPHVRTGIAGEFVPELVIKPQEDNADAAIP